VEEGEDGSQCSCKVVRVGRLAKFVLLKLHSHSQAPPASTSAWLPHFAPLLLTRAFFDNAPPSYR
jgi:hypothetical protein